MKVIPNAHNDADPPEYMIAGGSLKIRFSAVRSENGWIEFSPANMHIEFNGQEVEFCQGITLEIDENRCLVRPSSSRWTKSTSKLMR